MAWTVLVVDDHPTFRASARKLLELDGFRVIGEAADGETAIRLARDLEPGVVLLDIGLPDQDGFAVAEQLVDTPTKSCRILSRPEAVKGRRGRRKARWVPVPEFLLNALLESTPPDDRDRDTPLFTWPHSTVSPAQAVHKVMERACKSAGIPHYHPHDLRHRRVSLWHAQGVPAREIGDRVGQRQISTTLDTYTHVLAGAEVPDEALSALLVWSRCGLDTPAS